jgi:hypothetical protein
MLFVIPWRKTVKQRAYYGAAGHVNRRNTKSLLLDAGISYWMSASSRRYATAARIIAQARRSGQRVQAPPPAGSGHPIPVDADSTDRRFYLPGGRRFAPDHPHAHDGVGCWGRWCPRPFGDNNFDRRIALVMLGIIAIAEADEPITILSEPLFCAALTGMEFHSSSASDYHPHAARCRLHRFVVSLAAICSDYPS